MATAFFDSNVIVYSVSGETAKADRAEQLIKTGGWISVQVLNEVANVSRRKLKHDWNQTHDLLDSLEPFLSIVDLDIAIHRHGLTLSRRYGFSIYDAMIVAAALKTGCGTLYSEDMHHGLVIDGQLRIENPFLA